MKFRKIKQAYKIHDNFLPDLMRIRGLLKVLQERYYDDYPTNYLTTFTLNAEKSSEKAVDECWHILNGIVNR